ncbi:hypothetical protein [Vibrio parahaemolyticus]|uniref:hypothetical protein n=1 Tax=Vibrio parahaemolyticus TaxID=670 RepID=UPI0004E6EDBC|nr:hypothetical protein [Vibrio parahaemolyticus]AWG83629.1 hypothetical protein Vp2S01_1289 [Vibrio parahaemolyticus]KFE92966.1 hypothetical protein HB39_25095 [Vibrio parahaemolyticus]MBE4098983.1 hypothetical protein [Vibrio parahaemolyticus]MBE4134210.1 hypothetical protein [Vibrio parahaemolyticus]MBX5339287.1 hypothetical protein [Vibrio parahaemolyticus]
MYTQESKERSRKELWGHAVSTLTTQRAGSRILNKEYMETLWKYSWNEVLKDLVDINTDQKVIDDYFQYWNDFSNSCYKGKKASDLKVAYFCGPEPENDLIELLSLGVRIENIWAFEVDKKTYKTALDKARKSFPLLKIFPGSLADFVKTNHLSFDIIYLDFTGSLITKSMSTFSSLHGVFDEQALSDLGVLIVNTCEPDATPEVSDFLASYYNFQPMVECSAYGEDGEITNGEERVWFSEPASAHGYSVEDLKDIAENNIHKVYSAFSTSYPLYYSSIISPTLRFLRNKSLSKQLFSTNISDQKEVFARISDASSFFDFIEGSKIDEGSISGDRIFNPDGFPFWNFIDTLKTRDNKLCNYWFNEYSKPKEGASILDAARFRESLDQTLCGYDGLLSEKIKSEIKRVNAAIPDRNGGLFCDIPMPHLWLELALNQLGAPYHANLKNHRRWTYKAKVRQMHLEAYTFDRCRSLYDFLPMVDMYGDVLENLLPQIMVRCCIDAIHKQVRWPLANLYFGSNMACVNDGIKGAEFAELRQRKVL